MHKKFFLFLSIITIALFCESKSLAEGNLSTKINLHTPESLSEKANKNTINNSSEFIDNPLINGALGGFGNMIQGATGSSQNMQELQKQRLEYTRQQTNYDSD